MDWGEFIMDVGIATVIAVLLGSVLSFAFNTWSDNRGWKKVESKIGNTDEGSLYIQHQNIEKVILEKTLNIYNKVDKTNEIVIRNEERYGNLDANQKEIRNNVSKLVFDWEKAISENKELKSHIESIRLEKQELKMDNQRIMEKLNNLISNNEKIIAENIELKVENKNIREQLNKINLDNDKSLSDNKNLIDENKKLTKKLLIAEQLLDIKKDNFKNYDEVLEKDDELENEL